KNELLVARPFVAEEGGHALDGHRKHPKSGREQKVVSRLQRHADRAIGGVGRRFERSKVIHRREPAALLRELPYPWSESRKVGREAGHARAPDHSIALGDRLRVPWNSLGLVARRLERGGSSQACVAAGILDAKRTGIRHPDQAALGVEP